MCNYKRLNEKERHFIEIMLGKGYKLRGIASALKRSPSTISDEISRNKGKRGYRHIQANNYSLERAANKNVYTKFDNDMKHTLLSLLSNKLSPEQVVGECQIKSIPMICKSRIYNYIWDDKASGGEQHKLLRRSSKKHRRRYGKTDNRGKIPCRISISERPDEVEERKTVGHWEADTVIGGHHKGAFVTLLERATGLYYAKFVERKTKDLVADALIQMLDSISEHVLSITYDNGLEFAEHTRVMKEIKCQSYFADPYCSWQRGSNENANGLLRQWFPKKEALTRENTHSLDQAIKMLNNRPRKRYGYLTPNEVFENKTGVKLCYT